jgi:hypothetical protein
MIDALQTQFIARLQKAHHWRTKSDTTKVFNRNIEFFILLTSVQKAKHHHHYQTGILCCKAAGDTK